MKQNTLFKAWGVGTVEEGSSVVSQHVDHEPSSSSSKTEGVVGPLPEENEHFAFDDDFEHFLDDGVTEAELLQICDSDGPSKSTTTTNLELKQCTIPFHIGPSAATHSILNCTVTEEDIPGFDLEAGEVWIYPTNYPVREYQFNIVKKALFINTLVCLPTGLGKTFIAAVVMFNYYRWYPNGKIVFLAPTKPLVAQQIEACYRVMGIPQDATAEMTGNMPPKDRILMWQKKRVFFLTPQVMQNDLTKGTCPAKDVNCVVFDEAHKALGNHAYCQVIKSLSGAKSNYRVLALSASPGNDLKAVQHIVTNLQIGHIELRSDDSFDIQQYIHERKVEKIVVPLEGDILDIKNRFQKVLMGVMGRLSKSGVIYHSSPERMSKYQLLNARDQFRAAGPPTGVLAGAVEADFALAISLFHAFELLQLHGMRSFHQFLKNTFSAGVHQFKAKTDIIRSPIFNGIMKELSEQLLESNFSPDDLGSGTSKPHFPIIGNESLSNFSGRASCKFFYGHPKLRKLEEVILEHFRGFQNSAMSTRAMIFSQYRESVQEIADMLSRHLPLVKVMTFVGHSTGKSSSKGLTQKEQTEIVRKFREGGYNTLVATCVGEEGLDIGEVDLIVCFDAAKSPIRLVQRMGRTGRKRTGRIVVIVAEGKEEQMYNKSQSNKNSIHRAIKEGRKSLDFYQQCPRMVPRHINPQPYKMHMTIGEFSNANGKKGRKKGVVGVKSAQSKLSVNSSKRRINNAFLTDEELTCWSKELSLSDREFKAIERSVDKCFSRKLPFLSLERLKASSTENAQSSLENSYIQLTNSSGNQPLLSNKFSLDLSRWNHLQTAPILTKLSGHSTASNALTSSLEFVDHLQTSEGLGWSYDLEMQTFLETSDVKLAERDLPAKKANKKLKSTDESLKSRKRKQRRIFPDLSDDDDFVLPAKDDPSTKDLLIPGNSKAIERVCESPNDKKEDKNEPIDSVFLTASQHIVPRAPEGTFLEWLDDIEPSQSEQYTSLTKLVRQDIPDSFEQHNEFTSEPSLYNRSKIFPSNCSTPSKAISITSKERNSMCPESTTKNKGGNFAECFDDLTERDLFGEFSVLSAHEELKSRRESSEKRFPTPLIVSSTGQTGEGFRDSESPLKNLCFDKPGDSIDNKNTKTDELICIGDISVIAESDIETEEEPKQKYMETCSNDSYILHPGKRKQKKVNFLESPQGVVTRNIPSNKKWNVKSNERGSVESQKFSKNMINLEDSDDDFDIPLKKMRKFNIGWSSANNQLSPSSVSIGHSSSDVFSFSKTHQDYSGQKEVQDFIEDEAQLSGKDSMQCSDAESQDSYDMEDSFINDNSVLTQHVQTQKHKSIFKSPINNVDMYKQSLISPRDRMFTKRVCDANRGRFRMVFSQRYQLLNHYMKKAGFQDSDDRQKPRQLKQKFDFSSESEAEEVNIVYESEAEEVYGTEDAEEISNSLKYENENDTEDEVLLLGGHKQKSASSLSKVGEDTYSSVADRVIKPIKSSVLSEKETSVQVKSQMPCEEERTIDISRFSDIVISPGLHQGVKIIRTPPSFSLGMDDWLTEIEYDEHENEKFITEMNDEEFFESQDFKECMFEDDFLMQPSQDYH